MNTYKIKVKPLVPYEKLHYKDRYFFESLSDSHIDPDEGLYIFNNYFGENKDAALEAFHLEIPIASLEDFEIDIEKI